MSVIHSTGRPESKLVKISKVGAGYVYRKGCDYRCRECINWLSDIERCFLLGKNDKVPANAYCILWAKGTRPGDDHDWDDKPQGCYTPEEVGLDSLENGTLCSRCQHFSGDDACEIVEGKIDSGACCDNQSPKLK